jgi:hypothetical protein
VKAPRSDGLGYEYSDHPVPVCQFDYDAVDQAVFGFAGDEEQNELTQEQVNGAVLMLRLLLNWVWQDGMKNPDGLQLRSMVICWVFLKELRPMQLSELARGFGKKKQSLGRWVDDFKRRFPNIRTPHMRHNQ